MKFVQGNTKLRVTDEMTVEMTNQFLDLISTDDVVRIELVPGKSTTKYVVIYLSRIPLDGLPLDEEDHDEE